MLTYRDLIQQLKDATEQEPELLDLPVALLHRSERSGFKMYRVESIATSVYGFGLVNIKRSI